MTYNNALMAISLGLFSILPALGCEKQRSTRERIDNVLRYGCKGSCGGLLLYGFLTKTRTGASFSQEDLEPMLLAGGIGLLGVILYGGLNDFENRPRTTNSFIQKTYKKYRTFDHDNQSRQLKIDLPKRTLIE
jgi:hypothetical protein